MGGVLVLLGFVFLSFLFFVPRSHSFYLYNLYNINIVSPGNCIYVLLCFTRDTVFDKAEEEIVLKMEGQSRFVVPLASSSNECSPRGANSFVLCCLFAFESLTVKREGLA